MHKTFRAALAQQKSWDFIGLWSFVLLSRSWSDDAFGIKPADVRQPNVSHLRVLSTGICFVWAACRSQFYDTRLLAVRHAGRVRSNHFDRDGRVGRAMVSYPISELEHRLVSWAAMALQGVALVTIVLLVFISWAAT